MQCANCGGPVIWMGLWSNLTHTECQDCGAVNNQIVDEQEDDESED